MTAITLSVSLYGEEFTLSEFHRDLEGGRIDHLSEYGKVFHFGLHTRTGALDGPDRLVTGWTSHRGPLFRNTRPLPSPPGSIHPEKWY